MSCNSQVYTKFEKVREGDNCVYIITTYEFLARVYIFGFVACPFTTSAGGGNTEQMQRTLVFGRGVGEKNTGHDSDIPLPSCQTKQV